MLRCFFCLLFVVLCVASGILKADTGQVSGSAVDGHDELTVALGSGSFAAFPARLRAMAK